MKLYYIPLLSIPMIFLAGWLMMAETQRTNQTILNDGVPTITVRDTELTYRGGENVMTIEDNYKHILYDTEGQ